MPTIKGSTTATSNDLLSNETLAQVNQPSAVTLLAVGQTATDRIQLFVNQQALTNSLEPNLVTDADTGPNTSTDVLLDREIIAGGRLSMPCTAVGAQVQYQILIQPII